MSKRVKVIRDQDKTKKCKPHKTKDIVAEFGIGPKDWLKYRAIVGDPGDNIIRAKGCGPKTALKLLASGIDPSRARVEYPEGIEHKTWEVFRINYQLSEILTRSRQKQLTYEEKTQLKK